MDEPGEVIMIMFYQFSPFVCFLPLFFGACQQRPENEVSESKPENGQIETGALFYWPGSSSEQTFGHYEPGESQFIVDSTTNRDYEVKILGACLDIVAQDDTVLALCNDRDYRKRLVTQLLGNAKLLRFKYSKGKGNKDQLLISEVSYQNGQQASIRQAVLLELTPFSSNE